MERRIDFAVSQSRSIYAIRVPPLRQTNRIRYRVRGMRIEFQIGESPLQQNQSSLRYANRVRDMQIEFDRQIAFAAKPIEFEVCELSSRYVNRLRAAKSNAVPSSATVVN